MDGVELNTDETAVELLGGGEGRAGTAEGVEDRIARSGESLDQGPENPDRFLGRMEAVPGIGPVDHVGRRRRRGCGVAFPIRPGTGVAELHLQTGPPNETPRTALIGVIAEVSRKTTLS